MYTCVATQNIIVDQSYTTSVPFTSFDRVFNLSRQEVIHRLCNDLSQNNNANDKSAHLKLQLAFAHGPERDPAVAGDAEEVERLAQVFLLPPDLQNARAHLAWLV